MTNTTTVTSAMENSTWDYQGNRTDCGSSYTLANGYINWTGRETTFNHTAPVVCNTGYDIQGAHEIRCSADGSWINDTYCQGSIDIVLIIAIVSGVICAVFLLSFVAMMVYLKITRKCCFAPEPKPPHFEELEMEFKVWSKFRPTTVKKEEFPSYVAVLHKDNNRMFSDGFRLLCEQSPSHPTTTAESTACRPKSRFTNILPFDHSRVALAPFDEVEGSDFINANFIPGYSSPGEYIATQSPLLETRNDFWRMIWEQNVDIIVMLAKRVENIKDSLPKNQSIERYSSGQHCDPYWPEKIQTPVYYGDLEVITLSESVLSGYITRVMEVKLGIESRIVTQIHFLKWPDRGCPKQTWPFINFVTMVRHYKPQQLVVHCSTGVSRTGTFIAVDRLLQHVKEHDDIDIYGVILDMRNYRSQMVKTEEQFIFIYECLRHFITLEEDVDHDGSREGMKRSMSSFF